MKAIIVNPELWGLAVDNSFKIKSKRNGCLHRWGPDRANPKTLSHKRHKWCQNCGYTRTEAQGFNKRGHLDRSL